MKDVMGVPWVSLRERGALYGPIDPECKREGVPSARSQWCFPARSWYGTLPRKVFPPMRRPADERGAPGATREPDAPRTIASDTRDAASDTRAAANDAASRESAVAMR